VQSVNNCDNRLIPAPRRAEELFYASAAHTQIKIPSHLTVHPAVHPSILRRTQQEPPPRHVHLLVTPNSRVSEAHQVIMQVSCSSVAALHTAAAARRSSTSNFRPRGVVVKAQKHRSSADDVEVDGPAAASSSEGGEEAPHATTATARMPRRRLIHLAAATTAFVVSSKLSAPAPALASEFASDAKMAIMNRQGPVRFTDAEWQTKLKDEPYAYQVLRKEATERPFSSPLNAEKRAGTFACVGCGSPLFYSTSKYESGTGWPSFDSPVDAKAVTELPDYSIVFLPRTEVRCATCQGHIGHVFNDGPKETTGLRYCMNGASMKFQPAA